MLVVHCSGNIFKPTGQIPNNNVPEAMSTISRNPKIQRPFFSQSSTVRPKKFRFGRMIHQENNPDNIIGPSGSTPPTHYQHR
jgi:hypothetical protein